MIATLSTADFGGVAFLALTPIARYRAARDPFTDGGDQPWLWIVLTVAGFIAAAAMAIYIILASRNRRAAQAGQSFDAYADRAGISPEERALLSRIAQQAGLRRPESIFTMDAAFDRGIAGMVENQPAAEMSEPARANTFFLMESLREKLGFQRPGDAEVVRPTSSRQIPVGTRLTILHPDGAHGFEALLADGGAEGLQVEPPGPVAAEPGSQWLVRYPDGSRVWEFDATVVENLGARIIFRHSEQVRFYNRRRFPRVPLRRPARVARFPFVREDPHSEAPEFVAGRLVEIAGPGLKLQAPVPVQQDDRLLITLALEDDRVVEGLGKVRRVFSPEEGASVFAVELIGLRPEEIAELARRTSAAAKEHASEQAAARWKEAPAPSLQET
jgi:hypothetical protein